LSRYGEKREKKYAEAGQFVHDCTEHLRHSRCLHSSLGVRVNESEKLRIDDGLDYTPTAPAGRNLYSISIEKWLELRQERNVMPHIPPIGAGIEWERESINISSPLGLINQAKDGMQTAVYFSAVGRR
jgi:hypothetical protein